MSSVVDKETKCQRFKADVQAHLDSRDLIDTEIFESNRNDLLRRALVACSNRVNYAPEWAKEALKVW